MTNSARALVTAVAAVLFVRGEAAAQRTPTSVADALLEAQSLFTLATDRAPKSLSDALAQVKRAEMLASDEQLRRVGIRLNAENAGEARTLSALRARIFDLRRSLEGKYRLCEQKYRAIRSLSDDDRPAGALRMFAELPEDAPTEDPELPFSSLRVAVESALREYKTKLAEAEVAHKNGARNRESYAVAISLLEQASEIDRDQRPDLDARIKRIRAEAKASRPPRNHTVLIVGLMGSGLVALGGAAADKEISNRVTEMKALEPGQSTEWNTLFSEARRFEKTRNALYYAGAASAGAFAIYGVIRAIRASTTAGSSPGISRGRKVLGLVDANPLRPSVGVQVRF